MLRVQFLLSTILILNVQKLLVIRGKKKNMKKIAFAIPLFLFAASAGATPISLVGDTIDAMMIRTVDTGYGLGRITGYGLAAPFVVQDGPGDKKTYSSNFTLDVDGDNFAIKFITSAGWQDGIVFKLADLNFSPVGSSTLTELDVLTNLVGYTLNVGSDFVELGLGGTHFSTNTYFTGRFVVSSVPEPSSLALLALGLSGYWATSRARRTKGQPI